MTKPAPLRVAVLGGGPVGLEAALAAKSMGLAVTVYERGQPGGSLDRWGFLRMFTPFGLNVSPLGRAALLRDQPDRDLPADADLLTGREFKEVYVLPLAGCSALRGVVQADARVLAVGRGGWRKSDPETAKLPPFRLLVRAGGGAERFDAADVVLDCTGTLSSPNWAGDGGLPAAGEVAARPHLCYWVDDVRDARRAAYSNRTVVVIGGGYSAATVVNDLMAVAERDQSTWVVWLTHGPRGGGPLPRLANDPLRERDRLAARANHLAARCDGNLEYHPQTAVDEIVCHGPDKGFRVAGRVGGKPTSWEAERVVACVGYRPDLSVCGELRVGEPVGEVVTGEPGYFVLGQKAAGRRGDFLLADGHRHIETALAAALRPPGPDRLQGGRRAA